MSEREGDRTQPMDEVADPAAQPRRPTTWVGNTIAVLLVLAIGTLMAAGAVRAYVPTLRGAAGASPSPSAPAGASPTFTLRPLPTFTATPAPTPSPTPSPTPTRTATPTPRPSPP